MTTTTGDIGYIQHGSGTRGPFRTESVPVRNEYGDRWQAFFEGRWRLVRIHEHRTFIKWNGAPITIQIDGV